MERRIPLAFGPNASPAQTRLKESQWLLMPPIPVTEYNLKAENYKSGLWLGHIHRHTLKTLPLVHTESSTCNPICHPRITIVDPVVVLHVDRAVDMHMVDRITIEKTERPDTLTKSRVMTRSRDVDDLATESRKQVMSRSLLSRKLGVRYRAGSKTCREMVNQL